MRFALLFAGALAGLALSAAASADPAMNDFAWSARPIVIFAAVPDDPRVAKQMAMFEGQRAALLERDITVLTVWPNRVARDDAPTDLSADAMRSRYRVSGGEFAVLLIGKDTGVKLRESSPVDPNAIFALIDGMPMRRREMQENGG